MTDTKSIHLMAHLVAGFPDIEGSFSVARALIDGGASYLEVQFPFSDPSADGPVIQEACTRALGQGFRTDQGFELIRRIRKTCDIPVFIMGYASIVYARGVERFVQDALDAGASGLIIPDLPPDSDEGLYEAGKRYGVAVVPVIVPGISETRLSLVVSKKPQYLYTALRSGITGSHTEIGAENLAFLDRAGSVGAKVLAGFGIHDRKQVEILAPHVDVVVVGSEFVRAVLKSEHESGADVYSAVRNAAASLCGKVERRSSV